MKAAVLGGTSQIARSLIPFFLQKGVDLVLFARRPEVLQALPCRIESDFSRLFQEKFDLLMNCIGAGTPAVLGERREGWFSVLGHFDTLAMEYLKQNPECLYVHFSSGAVYDRNRNTPAADDSSRTFFPNQLTKPDFYAIAKLYAEARHREAADFRIVDLRIFSYFSRYTPLDSGYFMTDLANAMKNGSVLKTSPSELLRDYPAPADLAALILGCAKLPVINTALDVHSAKPVLKSEILSVCQEKFALQTALEETAASPNGQADCYIPSSHRAETLTGVAPRLTSMETILEELNAIIRNEGTL